MTTRRARILVKIEYGGWEPTDEIVDFHRFSAGWIPRSRDDAAHAHPMAVVEHENGRVSVIPAESIQFSRKSKSARVIN